MRITQNSSTRVVGVGKVGMKFNLSFNIIWFFAYERGYGRRVGKE